jgi:hypothetical protein
VGTGVVGVGGECAVVTLDCGGVLLALEAVVAEIEVGLGTGGVEGRSALEAGNGFARAAEGLEHDAQVVVGVGEVGSVLERLADVVLRRWLVAALVGEHAEEVESVEVLGIVRQCETVELLGFLEAAGLVGLKGKLEDFAGAWHEGYDRRAGRG